MCLQSYPSSVLPTPGVGSCKVLPGPGSGPGRTLQEPTPGVGKTQLLLFGTYWNLSGTYTWRGQNTIAAFRNLLEPVRNLLICKEASNGITISLGTRASIYIIR